MTSLISGWLFRYSMCCAILMKLYKYRIDDTISSFFELRVDAGSKELVPEGYSDSEVTGGISVVMFEMVNAHIFEPSDVGFRCKVAAVVHPFV